ncbi:hypothetical protein MMC09_001111 [Bachmanniomyces sp. S44760]|nr:hypothetical protein [Bachmanniomyces sp. S44760]
MSTQAALVVAQVGKPLVRQIRSVPIPKRNEVLVKIAAAGLSSSAQQQRDFGRPSATTLPAIPCNDIVGTVDKIGPGVLDYLPGDLVFGQSHLTGRPDVGGLQQYAILEADMLARVPANITVDQAATLTSSAVSAYIALFHSSGLGITPPSPPSTEAKVEGEEGEEEEFVPISANASRTIVILGADTASGKVAVQFANLAGFGRVIAVTSSASAFCASSKQQSKKSNQATASSLRSYGATHIVSSPNNEIAAHREVLEITRGEDITYVLDATSNTSPVRAAKSQSLAVSLLSERTHGKIATLSPVAINTDPTPDPATIQSSASQKDFSIVHVVGSSHLHRPLGRAFWKKLPGWVEEGTIKPLEARIVEGGLNPGTVNKVLDGWRDGTGVDADWIVKPNGRDDGDMIPW